MRKNKLGPARPLPVALCDVSRKRVYFAAKARYYELSNRSVKDLLDNSDTLATARVSAKLSSMVEAASERYDWFIFTEMGWSWPTATNPTTPI